MYEAQFDSIGESRVIAMGEFPIKTGCTDHPHVVIDTNHHERALRAVPMGRKVLNFCWSELCARHIGIESRRRMSAHGIDPYTYLVDALQGSGEYVAEITLGLWTAPCRHAPAARLAQESETQPNIAGLPLTRGVIFRDEVAGYDGVHGSGDCALGTLQ